MPFVFFPPKCDKMNMKSTCFTAAKDSAVIMKTKEESFLPANYEAWKINESSNFHLVSNRKFCGEKLITDSLYPEFKSGIKFSFLHENGNKGCYHACIEHTFCKLSTANYRKLIL